MILYELFSYDLLRVVWWLLLGVLLIGFALTDGFDMGVGALLPFVGRTDVERRVVRRVVRRQVVIQAAQPARAE